MKKRLDKKKARSKQKYLRLLKLREEDTKARALGAIYQPGVGLNSKRKCDAIDENQQQKMKQQKRYGNCGEYGHQKKIERYASTSKYLSYLISRT